MNRLIYLIAAVGMLLLPLQSHAMVANGADAPDFTLPGHDGKSYSLSDYAGKTVVLEWFNHECPFVRKHYDSNNMQMLQKKHTADGVVWFSIISSAEGKQGHMTAQEAAIHAAEQGAKPTAVLIDESGEVGQLYGAKTTPHMFIVNGEGKLAYQGAIDSINSADKEDVKKANNYVERALYELKSGKSVSVASTKQYGCSVKY